jgi:hypothetical protein
MQRQLAVVAIGAIALSTAVMTSGVTAADNRPASARGFGFAGSHPPPGTVRAESFYPGKFAGGNPGGAVRAGGPQPAGPAGAPPTGHMRAGGLQAGGFVGSNPAHPGHARRFGAFPGGAFHSAGLPPHPGFYHGPPRYTGNAPRAHDWRAGWARPHFGYHGLGDRYASRHGWHRPRYAWGYGLGSGLTLGGAYPYGTASRSCDYNSPYYDPFLCYSYRR